MTTIPFDFAPHEWPGASYGLDGHGFADAVFRANWNGKEKEIAARAICDRNVRTLHFRDLACPEQTWCIGTYDKRPRFYRSRKRGAVYNWEYVASYIEKQVRLALEKSTYGRFFLLQTPPATIKPKLEETNENRPSYATFWKIEGNERLVGLGMWVYLDSQGETGCWYRHARQSPAPFRILKGTKFEEQIRDASSDARFALAYNLAPDVLRGKCATRLARGTWKELEQVLRSIALIEPMGDLVSHWIFGPNICCWTSEKSSRQPSRLVSNARLRRWSLHLNCYFAPFQDPDALALHLCAKFQERLRLVEFRIASATASQHERLEAALFLRDWGRDKIPPGELRLLLPKL